MAWLREDWAFMLVLPTVLDRAPCFRHDKVWGGRDSHHGTVTSHKE